MSKNTPEAKVDAFLESPEAARHRGGGTCRTCALPNREMIDRALQRFQEARATGRTTVPWRSFVQHAIVKDADFAYPYKWRALLKHAEDCLELPLT